MAFAPGQFITAQRLNRLQSTTYWAQATGAFSATTETAIAGTSLSITVQTNGATANFWWSADFRQATAVSTGQAAVRPYWDVNGAPLFAIGRLATVNDQISTANSWSTTIPTAGTYTFQLRGTMFTNTTLNIYTSLMVEIKEVV